MLGCARFVMLPVGGVEVPCSTYWTCLAGNFPESPARLLGLEFRCKSSYSSYADVSVVFGARLPHFVALQFQGRLLSYSKSCV